MKTIIKILSIAALGFSTHLAMAQTDTVYQKRKPTVRDPQDNTSTVPQPEPMPTQTNTGTTEKMPTSQPNPGNTIPMPTQTEPVQPQTTPDKPRGGTSKQK